MKKLFAEFKKFISKGNVLDMAVGVIVVSGVLGVGTVVRHEPGPVFHPLEAVGQGRSHMVGQLTLIGTAVGVAEAAHGLDVEGGGDTVAQARAAAGLQIAEESILVHRTRHEGRREIFYTYCNTTPSECQYNS